MRRDLIALAVLASFGGPEEALTPPPARGSSSGVPPAILFDYADAPAEAAVEPRREHFVKPPLRSTSGSRMSAAQVAEMSRRRSRQRAAGKRR